MAIELPERIPCPFCENVADRHPCAFITREKLVSSFVNPAQYEKGAVLIVPNRHAPTILDVTREEFLAIYQHAQALTRAILKTFRATGFNVFQNNGVDAGQSVPHYHLHVVPRYGQTAHVYNEKRFPKIPIEERLAIAELIRANIGST